MENQNIFNRDDWTYQSLQLRIGQKTIMAYFNESLTGGQIAYSPRMHLHPPPYYEVILFRQGVAQIFTEHQEVTVQPGSVALIPPNMNHRLKIADDITDPSQAPRCATFMLVPDNRSSPDGDGRLVEALFAIITDLVVLENMEHMFRYIDEVTMELHRAQTGYMQVASNEMENFFIGLLRSFGEITAKLRPPVLAMTDKNRMLEIEDHLGRAITRNLTCSELAEDLHLSVRQLERLIQKLYGKSYRSLVYEMKMNYARELLVTSDTSLQRISDFLGYASVNVFHAAYRRFFGVTPVQSRKIGLERRV